MKFSLSFFLCSIFLLSLELHAQSVVPKKLFDADVAKFDLIIDAAHSKGEVIQHLQATRYKLKVQIQESKQRYTDMDCLESDEARIHPLWKQYDRIDSRQVEQKARILSEMVEGIRYSEAIFLIEKGYFKFKPSHWNALKEQIYNADDEQKTGFAYWVIANASNSSRTRDRLGMIKDRCKGVSVVEIFRQVTTSRDGILDQPQIDLKISYGDGTYFRDEKDSIHFIYDGEELKAEPDSTNINRYDILKSSPTEIQIKSGGRYLVRSEWAEGKAELKFVRDFQAQTLKVKFIDCRFDALNDGGHKGRSVLSLEVWRLGRGRDAESRRIFSADYNMDSKERSLDLADEVRHLGQETWRSGESYFVKASFRRLENEFFAPERSAEFVSEVLLAP